MVIFSGEHKSVVYLGSVHLLVSQNYYSTAYNIIGSDAVHYKRKCPSKVIIPPP